MGITRDLPDILSELVGIWKYASADIHAKNEGKKTPEEYDITIIKLWDYLDKLPLQTVESLVVELEGKVLGEHETIDKILKSQLSYYLQVREEQEVVLSS